MFGVDECDKFVEDGGIVEVIGWGSKMRIDKS